MNVETIKKELRRRLTQVEEQLDGGSNFSEEEVSVRMGVLHDILSWIQEGERAEEETRI